MVALFQLFGAAATTSRAKAAPPDASAVRTPRLVVCEPPEPWAAKASETTPATSNVAAPADLRAVLLNAAIAVTRPTVVVRVLIAPVVLRDPTGCGAPGRLSLDAWGRGFRCSTRAMSSRSPACARLRGVTVPAAAGDHHGENHSDRSQ